MSEASRHLAKPRSPTDTASSPTCPPAGSRHEHADAHLKKEIDDIRSTISALQKKSQQPSMFENKMEDRIATIEMGCIHLNWMSVPFFDSLVTWLIFIRACAWVSLKL